MFAAPQPTLWGSYTHRQYRKITLTVALTQSEYVGDTRISAAEHNYQKAKRNISLDVDLGLNQIFEENLVPAEGLEPPTP